jgi:hypothetical protein
MTSMSDPFQAPQPAEVIPEPGTLAMMGAGVITLAGVLRRKQRGK